MTIWLPELTPAGPRYRAIAEAITSDIASGRLAPGTRLPPQRELAWRLGVTVGTVSRAYAEVEAQGLIGGEVGRGTYVKELPQPRRTRRLDRPGEGPERIAFNRAQPPEMVEENEWSQTLRAMASEPAWRRLLDYPPSAGLPAHREAGAAWLSCCGFEVSPERVILTSGAQAALYAVFATLSRPGSLVFAGELNFPGIYGIAHGFGLTLQGVACDAEGLIPEALEEACGKAGAGESSGSLLYIVPSLHNPTSITLDRRRREAIAETARRHGLQIIEDDIFARLATDPPAPISTVAPERSFYISSLSKTTSPGLRCGFLVAPETARASVLAAVDTAGSSPSPISAEVACRWIEDGSAERVLSAVRQEIRERRTIVEESLGRDRCHSGEGSLYTWLQLPDDWSSADFAAAALERGVAVNQSRPFALDMAQETRAVRVCFGSPTDRKSLRRGLELLAELLRSPAAARFGHVV